MTATDQEKKKNKIVGERSRRGRQKMTETERGVVAKRRAEFKLQQKKRQPWLCEKYAIESLPSMTTSHASKALCRNARHLRRTLNASRQKNKGTKATKAHRPLAAHGRYSAAESKSTIGEILSCRFCDALIWKAETKNQTICCQGGRVRLPKVPPRPPELEKLYESADFRYNIRTLNSLMAFTSIGGKVDHTVTGTREPFVYRINGQNHHRIGSLVPIEGKMPQFLQLYIFDTANEVQNRLNIMDKPGKGKRINKDVVTILINMVDKMNTLAKIFRNARDRYEEGNGEEFKIRLISQNNRGKQYDLPVSDEIGGLIVGDFTLSTAFSLSLGGND